MMNHIIKSGNAVSVTPYQFNELSPNVLNFKAYAEWKNNLALLVFTMVEKMNGMMFELYLKECVEKIERKRERASPHNYKDIKCDYQRLN